MVIASSLHPITRPFAIMSKPWSQSTAVAVGVDRIILFSSVLSDKRGSEVIVSFFYLSEWTSFDW